MVNTWAATNRLILGQIKLDKKSNEITVVPELLRMLGLSRCIVTTDALDGVKTIVKQVNQADADYPLALKNTTARPIQHVKSILAIASPIANDKSAEQST